MTSDEPAPDRVRAVLEEAARKSGLLWVRRADGRPQPVWHLWHDGAAYVLCGGEEQPAPDLAAGDEVEVSVRSKDNGSRLGVWAAAVDVVPPDSADWATLAPLLAAKRLNAADGPDAPQRWARSSTLYRLRPVGTLETWADPDRDSGAAPAAPTPAARRLRLPFLLGRRPR